MRSDLKDNHKCDLSKVGLHKRFTPDAVNFLRQVLSLQLSNNIDFKDNKMSTSLFSGICIKDSTKMKLPDCFIKEYPGYGSKNGKTANLCIQYEYELLSGKCNSLYFTNASRNDQLDSKETIDSIQPNTLYLRDLGYVTSSYLKGIIKKQAFFINRLPKIGVYQRNRDEFKPINWQKIHTQMQKTSCRFKEIEVFLGPKKEIKARMVLFPMNSQVVAKRLRRASKRGSRKTDRYQISKEYRLKSHYNIFITNVPKEVMSADQIQRVYKLRWQIELIFKAWKSHIKIDKIKAMKTERFQCQLIAHLIWFLLSWRIFQLTNFVARRINEKQGTSVLKFYQYINRKKQYIREIIKFKKGVENWLNRYVMELTLQTLIEKKNDQITHIEIIRELCIA